MNLRIIIILIVNIFCFIGNGQDCNVAMYNTDSGLPNNNVNNLIFDKYNNLWIGTQGGLICFNGQTFHSIHHKEMSSRVLYLQKDKYDDVYIIDGDYTIFKQNSALNPLEIAKVERETVRQNFEPESLLLSPETHTSKIQRHFYKNLKYQIALLQISNQERLKVFFDNYYAKIEKILIGAIFINNTHIIQTNGNKWKIILDTLKTEDIASDLPSDCFSKGLFFHTETKTFLLYDNIIFQVAIENGTITKTIVIRDVPIDKIKDNIVIGTYNKKQNFFVFGSEKHGLYFLKPPDFKNRVHVIEPSEKQYQKFGNAFYSQAEMPTGEILVNNYLIFNKDAESRYLPDAIPHNRAFNYKDGEGRIWLNNYDTLILRSKADTSTLVIENVKDNKFDFKLLSMAQTDDSTYTIISHTHVFQVIVRTNTLYKISTKRLNEIGIPEGEKAKFIYFKKEIQKLCILTNKNFYLCDPSFHYCALPNASGKNDYRIIQPLNDEFDFVGTYGQGYYLFDDKEFKRMPLDEKGYLKFAHTALVDNNGFVWISTNNGLYKTKFQNLLDFAQRKTHSIFYYYYEKSSGFKTNEFNGGCQSPAIKLDDNTFSFSTMDGLVQFDPIAVPSNFPIESIHLTNIRIDGKNTTSIPNTIEFGQRANEINIEVSTAYYGHGNNLILEYRIKRLHDKWKRLSENKYIRLQNVPHGKFNLEVRKREGFGSENFGYMQHSIVVQPYFYQTSWFIILASLCLLLCLHLFNIWYNRYTIRKNKILQDLVASQHSDLIKNNDLLREQIKQNDLFQSIFVHDIKSPIRFITSNSELICNHWESLGSSQKLENIKIIHDTSSKISHFIDVTLMWIKLRNRELEAIPSSFDVYPLLISEIALYKDEPKISNGTVTVNLRCEKSLIWVNDPLLIATLIRNIFSNSVKYTQSGQIELYALSDMNGTQILGCRDTGKGMPPQTIELIMQENYNGNDIRKDSFRMGFVIIKEILRLLDGKLEIKSDLQRGTDVRMLFDAG